MAKLPGVGDVVGLLRAQTEALAGLPGTVQALSRSIRNLDQVLIDARDAIVVIRRVVDRIDTVVGELEQPVHDLVPGLVNAAAVLRDPIITTVPDTLRQVQAEALPLLGTVGDTQAAVAGISEAVDRLMALLDDATARMAALPGAGLVGAWAARRPPRRGEPGDTVEVVKPPR